MNNYQHDIVEKFTSSQNEPTTIGINRPDVDFDSNTSLNQYEKGHKERKRRESVALAQFFMT